MQELFTLPELVELYHIGQDVKVKDLNNHIARLMVPLRGQTYKNGFDVEFDHIDLFPSTFNENDFKAASMEENRRLKNRYQNVLPPDPTRVQLSILNNEPSSDYINANWINGLCPNTQRAYISTQGPLVSTFSDFWRMVWEFKSSVIVMLTREFENGRPKCDKYWPADLDDMDLGSFKLSLDSEIVKRSGEFTVRHLILQDLSSKETRKITQLQYTGWPDHGLPASTDAFLEIVEQANSNNSTKGPIVVHCSAGIGRSGTFITVHSIIENLKRLINEGVKKEDISINIVSTILKLREQRLGMVQTKEQEYFCYLAILQAAEQLHFEIEPAQTPDIWTEYDQKKSIAKTFPASITDDELISQLVSHRVIDLSGCYKLTSRVLLSLEKLESLQTIKLGNCKIKESAIQLFKSNNPHLQVDL